MPRPKVYQAVRVEHMTVPDFSPGDKVMLSVVHNGGLLFWYNADANTPLKDLMLLTELYTRVDYCAFIFICNYRMVDETDTPASLGLCHGDTILMRLDRRFRNLSTVDFSPAFYR